MTLFLLQIVKPDGTVVQMPGGGPLERDLVRACTDAIVAKGVGLFKTEAQVKAAIEAGIAETIRDLKFDTVRVVNG
jgi:hypothetical protein